MNKSNVNIRAIIFSTLVISMIFGSCGMGSRQRDSHEADTAQKKALSKLAASTKVTKTTENEQTAFPRGKNITNRNFIGTVWLDYLSENDTTYNVNIGAVTFEPGARTNWHYHKGGQILLVTAGKGLYQEKGKPVEIIEKGDVKKCPPNVPHWHGATPTTAMTHIAIGTNTDRGGAVWQKPVTDLQYTDHNAL